MRPALVDWPDQRTKGAPIMRISTLSYQRQNLFPVGRAPPGARKDRPRVLEAVGQIRSLSDIIDAFLHRLFGNGPL